MQPKVITIGLGYIGLPTSALIANSKIPVLGVDISQFVVDTINSGNIHIVEPELDKAVATAVKSGYLKAATKPISADVYLVVVPTPFKGDYEPDISYVEAATDSVINLLKEGDLFIIESTSPVGTTDRIANYVYSKRSDLRDKIFIAYCPERVLPGNVMHELVHNDRVIGGINDESTNKAISFYRQFVQGQLHPTNAKTAEMCKLTENASRDVQIAFANELSLICAKAGINVWDLIALANKHPRVNILSPGCGVGGHCIAVDPYFLVHDFPDETRVISQARYTNSYKPEWCVEQIKESISEFEMAFGHKPKIAFMGLAFKPNIDDLRESPAISIVEKVLQNIPNISYSISEPNIEKHPRFELLEPQHAVNSSDIIVFLVAHNAYKSLLLSENKIVKDFCGLRIG